MSLKSNLNKNSAAVELEVEGLASISKKVQESCIGINKSEVKFLVDTYYQTQDLRKIADNQIRSLQQGFDESIKDARDENLIPSALQWLAENKRSEEKQLKKMLETFAANDDIGKWCMSVVGIGPVIAAGLIAYFDIDKATHYNNFLSYAGLNDNNNPWLGKEKAKKEVEEWLKKHPGYTKAKTLPSDIVFDICEKYGRNKESALKQAYDSTKLKKGEYVLTKASVIAWLSKPPYNRELKTLCWKIGESFVKVCNKPDSLYGRLYKERTAYENAKNENGDYAEQAKHILETRNISNADQKKCYEAGMLPKGHIMSRAKRWTVKIFISHLFEAMYWKKFHMDPPTPWPLAYTEHVDYTVPEVDYKSMF